MDAEVDPGRRARLQRPQHIVVQGREAQRAQRRGAPPRPAVSHASRRLSCSSPAPQITVNALDRHVAAGFGARPALTFEADDGASRTYSYEEVLDEVCALAHVLASHGVTKGSTVSLCLPMVPSLLFAMLACARIGAVHSVIFAGFSGARACWGGGAREDAAGVATAPPPRRS